MAYVHIKVKKEDIIYAIRDLTIEERIDLIKAVELSCADAEVTVSLMEYFAEELRKEGMNVILEIE